MALTEVDTKGIKNASIKLEDIENGTSSDNGKFLKNNDGAAPSWSAVNTDLLSDTSPQLGGSLATNGNNILVADNDEIRFGSGIDLIVKSDGTDSYITGDDGKKLNIGLVSDNDMIELGNPSIAIKSNTTLSNNAIFEIAGGSWLRTYEPTADGNNYIQFSTRALTNNQTFFWNTASATEGQYLKLGSNANLEFADVAAGAKGGGTNKIFWENEQTIDYNYTITNNHNAMTAGPVEIAATGNGDGSAVVVTVGDGETWTIV